MKLPIAKFIRGQKPKRLQAQFQGAPCACPARAARSSKATIQALRGEDWGVEISFGNYR